MKFYVIALVGVISKETQIANFIEILPAETDVSVRTDRHTHDEANSR